MLYHKYLLPISNPEISGTNMDYCKIRLTAFVRYCFSPTSLTSPVTSEPSNFCVRTETTTLLHVLYNITIFAFSVFISLKFFYKVSRIITVITLWNYCFYTVELITHQKVEKLDSLKYFSNLITSIFYRPLIRVLFPLDDI